MLAEWPFIPGGMLIEFTSVLHEGPHTGKRSPLYSTDQHTINRSRLAPERDDTYLHPVVHSINRNGVLVLD